MNESADAVDIIEAASTGEIMKIKEWSGNPNLYTCDYDNRTALHLAASNGHMEVSMCVLSHILI